MKKLIMELLGTFFFIFAIAMTGNALAIAGMLMAFVYIGGYISGGHYNPMVTVAHALSEKMKWEHVPAYVLAQISGGTLAYLATWYFRGSIRMPMPAAELMQAGIMELLLAFVFALLVLVIAGTKTFRSSAIFGLAIGFVFPTLMLLGAPISGGVFNPAIALGAAFVGAFKGIDIDWMITGMYVASSLLGGALAAYAFTYFVPDNER